MYGISPRPNPGVESASTVLKCLGLPSSLRCGFLYLFWEHRIGTLAPVQQRQPRPPNPHRIPRLLSFVPSGWSGRPSCGSLTRAPKPFLPSADEIRHPRTCTMAAAASLSSTAAIDTKALANATHVTWAPAMGRLRDPHRSTLLPSRQMYGSGCHLRYLGSVCCFAPLTTSFHSLTTFLAKPFSRLTHRSHNDSGELPYCRTSSNSLSSPFLWP